MASPKNRAIKFRAYASIGGKSLPLNSGTVLGRIGFPSAARVNVAYGSVNPKAFDPMRVWCVLGKAEHTLFEGQFTSGGRTKHEGNRSLTLTGEGYSNAWFRTCLYQVNELAPSGLSYGDAFRARSVGDPTGYTAGKRIADLSNLMGGDLPGFIMAVLRRTAQSAGSGGEALSKVKVLSDGTAAKLFSSGDTARRIFLKLVEGQSSSVSPVMTFLQSIMDLLYYEMVDMVGPAPVGRIIFKPRLIFAPAAGGNVFLPENYASFQENRSFVDAPTRMMLQTNAFLEPTQSGSLDVTTLVRFAPQALQAQFDSINRSGTRDPSALTRMLSQAITGEEHVRGIVAEYGALSPAEWLLAGGGGIAASDAALGQVADYKLRLKQLEFRTASVNHALAPEVAVGFPGIIVDTGAPSIRGLVSQVSHSFGVEGVSTQINMTHTRTDGEGMDATNPPWIDDNYASGANYGALLGKGPSSL